MEMANRVVRLLGYIDEDNFRIISDELTNFVKEDKEKQIDMFINFGGGAISVGFSFYDLITSILKPVNLRTIALGQVSSVAVLVFMSGNHRLISKNSRIFVHQFGKTFREKITFSSRDLKSMGEELMMSEEKFAKIIAERSKGKLTEGQVRDMMLRETWILPEQALEMGLADEIIE